MDDESEAVDELLEFLQAEGYPCYGASSSASAQQVFSEHPDIALLIVDLKMPGQSGLELLRQLHQDWGGKRSFSAILISGHAERADLVEAIRVGVVDFLDKPLDLQALCKSIQSLSKNRIATPLIAQPLIAQDELLQRLQRSRDDLQKVLEQLSPNTSLANTVQEDAARVATHSPPATTDETLTPRMWQVVDLLSHGYTNAKIAVCLGISENTVKLYVTQILQRTGVENRTQLALWAREHQPPSKD